MYDEKIKDNNMDLFNSKISLGQLYWITGLSGAGKTTIGTMLYEYIRSKKDNVVLLDGDILRKVFKNSDYTREGRRKLGFQYSRLCQMLTGQGIDVVMCTVAMFDDIRNWNRDNIERYIEIYLEVSLEELINRNQKGLYSEAVNSRKGNLAGVNQEVELPKSPDIIIKNYGDMTPKKAVELIIELFFDTAYNDALITRN